MLNRSQHSKEVAINIVGSSVFGRYPKISIEKTYNMFESDQWMVPYAGYKSVIQSSTFGNAAKGRAIYTSTKLNRLVAIYDNRVYLIDLFFDQNSLHTFDQTVIQIGTLQTSSGICYITENNKPQIVISDNVNIYFYDPSLTPAQGGTFQVATANGIDPINFKPGFVDFHDTYILCAATNDQTYAPPATNTWRLGTILSSIPPDPVNDGKLVFPSDNAHVGLLQTKPDNTKAVVRFPSKGNVIYVMGEVVSEPWFDAGLQGFPYQRSSSYNIDYGCINPSTIAATDTLVAWLALNEKSGPIIIYSNGSDFNKITTDGIDYLFSQLQAPDDSRAFIYRQDGHLFYHINFYTDNLSLFYDFNTKKFYHASDEKGNVFIADQVAFFNNQYYFVSSKSGNLFAFDTIFTTYDGAEIPRIRICKPIRLASQEYFIANDVGFTIEQGHDPYQRELNGVIYLITEDGKKIITESGTIFILTELGDFIEFEDGSGDLLDESSLPFGSDFLILEENLVLYVPPRVDLSISIDGGESFSSKWPYYINNLGRRKNKLLWWRLGAANDITCMFEFWGLGRFVATDGIMNVRQ